MPKLTKYTVISWDNDAQQVFWDPIMAETEERARQIVGEVRNYAEVVDVLTAKELREVAKNTKRSELWYKTEYDLARWLDAAGDCFDPEDMLQWAIQALPGRRYKTREVEIDIHGKAVPARTTCTVGPYYEEQEAFRVEFGGELWSYYSLAELQGRLDPVEKRKGCVR